MHLLSDPIPADFLISGFLHAPNARRFFAAAGKLDKSTTLVAFVAGFGTDTDGEADTEDFTGEITATVDFVGDATVADCFVGKTAEVVVVVDGFTDEVVVEVADDLIPFPFSTRS